MRELPQVELGKICSFQNGRAFKKNEWRSSGLPIIRIQNLNNVGADFNYFDGEYDQKIEVYDDDLLFSWSGTVGSSFGPHIWRRGKGLLNQHIFKIGLSKDIDRLYAFYVLRFVTAGIEKNVKGAVGLRHVTKSDLNNFKIPLPDLDEQKRIVAILDEAFAGIDTAIANTEKNLANARELFESYLNSVFAKQEDGWCELTLKEVCEDYGRGKSKHRPRNAPELYGGDYPFIQTGEVRQSDHYITTFSKTYNEKGLAQSKLWPKGTICITIAANIAETGVLAFDACFPDSIIGLVVDQEKASNSYVEFLLQSLKTVLKAKGKGSAQDNINLGTFENLKFPFPSLNAQNEIVENMDELLMLIRRLETIYQQKLNSLSELKQSLLQKAFSGELTAEGDKLMDEAVA